MTYIHVSIKVSINNIKLNYAKLQYVSAAAPLSALLIILCFSFHFYPYFWIHLPSLFNGPYLVCAPVKAGCWCCCFRDEYSGVKWAAICLLSIIDPWLTRVQLSSWLQHTKIGWEVLTKGCGSVTALPYKTVQYWNVLFKLLSTVFAVVLN